MKKVTETNHLQKRRNIWYYYRRVPVELISKVGKTFIKKSLSTSNLKEAKIRRNALNVKFDAEFAAADGTAETSGTSLQPASLTMLTEHLRQRIFALDDRNAARLASDPPVDETEKADMIQDVEMDLQAIRNRDDPNGASWVHEAALKVATQGNLSDQGDDNEFAEIVRRGLIELHRRKLDRLNDHYDAGHHDTLFNPAASPTVTFGELADMFWSERLAEYEANDTTAKRSNKVQTELDFVREVVGDDKPLSQVTDDVVQAFRKTLDRTPANRKKLYPKLTLEQAQEKGVSEGRPTLSPTTQSQYIRTLRDVLAVAVRKKLIHNNPAADVKPLKKNKIGLAEKRLPWHDEQITAFFTGKFYQSCAPGAVKPYNNTDKGWRFWLPLLMLLTGARPNEVCQLHVGDLKQTEKGTWFLDLIETADDDGKTFKTSASRRRVPLHPKLVKIGFVDFVKARDAKHGKKESRLFPEITPDKYGNTATYPARRFREHFIPAEITLGDKQTFYSLRHNVRDALRRAKAPAETLLAVTGWAPAGKAVGDSYGDPGSPDLHIGYVSQIDYPGLDLSFLYGAEVE